MAVAGPEIDIRPALDDDTPGVIALLHGADTVISLGAQTIVLSGVAMSSLTASDFLFV